jgi:predicted Zn-dependent peptidase
MNRTNDIVFRFLAVSCAAVVAAVPLGCGGGSGADAAATQAVAARDLHTVEKGSFDMILPVSGELAAQQQVELRNKLETRFWRGLQTAQQKATSLAFWEVTGGDWRGLFAQSERYNRVTLDDVRRVAREVLRPEGRTVVVGRPDDAEDVA